MAEALGTRTIPAELAAILAAHSQTIHKDGSTRMPEERTGWGLHSFLSHIALGVGQVPGLERVTLVGINKNGRVNLIHSLLSICVDVYSIEFRLFACLGDLISPDFFAARRSVRGVPRVDHIAHLGGISPINWQTKPCERATKAEGKYYIDLDFQGLAFVPSDCAAWLLGREADGPSNVFEALAGLFPILTGR